jgi:Tfp pilus assembly protein PilE
MKGNINLLIELGAVFLILGILGWITYNQFSLAAARSRDADRMSSLHELSKAVQLYYKDYGHLPKEELINSLWGKTWKDIGDYNYLEVMPKENYLGKEFCYQNSEDGASFLFFADLEDKGNPDCKKDQWECSGIKYCYRDVLPAEIVK